LHHIVLALLDVSGRVTILGLGATTAVALIILGQLSLGLIIDTLGLFDVPIKPLDGTRIAAIAFLLIGGYLITK